jgi:hypothetical protein
MPKYRGEKPDWKRKLVRPRRIWDYNTEIYLKGIGYGDMDWVHLPQDKVPCLVLVSKVMNFMLHKRQGT